MRQRSVVRDGRFPMRFTVRTTILHGLPARSKMALRTQTVPQIRLEVQVRQEDGGAKPVEEIFMKTRVMAISLLGASVLMAGASQAQQPNPLDAIPDNMPFDIPYGAPISLDRADALIAAAVAEAKKRNWKMNVAVVDSGGNLVAFQRMDGAQLASISISEHKARTAAKYRRETKVFEGAMQSFAYVATLDDVIGSRGGIPLVEGGKLIGAIGCSGGTGSQDEVTCKAGAASLK